MKTFKYDHRENKGLHALYVKYAISGILAIDSAIARIQDEEKTTHAEILCKMFEQRSKLIKENSAYAEAKEFLEELVAKKLLLKLGDCFFGTRSEETE